MMTVKIPTTAVVAAAPVVRVGPLKIQIKK
jgi:hypothetical protein